MAEHSPSERNSPAGREIYEATLSGAQTPPYIPKLRSDPPPYHPEPRSLAAFRESEGRESRKQRLRALWRHICKHGYRFDVEDAPKTTGFSGSSIEKAKELRAAYEDELFHRVGGDSKSLPVHIPWKDFKAYAEAKETELWAIFHDELDLDGNGHLESRELDAALRRAGITLSPATLNEFMTYLTSSPHQHAITFSEFRDFLLLLPRKISASEIYRYFEMKKYLGDDGKGIARVTMEGDVSLSAEDKPPTATVVKASHLDLPTAQEAKQSTEEEGDTELFADEDGDEDHHGFLEGHTALRFLLAGGVAGAVSRTCTAPFDRLKIFLITRPPDLGGAALASKPGVGGLKVIGNAVARIYMEGGILAFWTGNALSVAKIFPESAIKFFTYETAKRGFARYWDNVEDPRDISGASRFLSGGIGGISSQLSIYPIETLKTQMMSSTGQQKRTLFQAARHVWALGGFRAYYRGLTIGLCGVFPYSAIDMSTFEALKLAYTRSTGKEEPGVLALLSFGSISGSVGATSVYPMNLVRTRLQASGSSGHPQIYAGIWDVVNKTWEKDGFRGFYRGLLPTLAKVVPAVSISYVVYDHSKKTLGI